MASEGSCYRNLGAISKRKRSNEKLITAVPSSSVDSILQCHQRNVLQFSSGADLGIYFDQYPGSHRFDPFIDFWSDFKMKPFVDSNGASPPPSPAAEKLNGDKLTQQGEMVLTVETRLNQIREYIRTTLLMMESLKQSSDPRAKTQHEKLARMVEDLYDSEIKLSKLLQQYRSQESENENVEGSQKEAMEDDRKARLYKKMEESQKKLVQLQEHQSQLVGMQKAMTESLKEARQLRSNLALLEPEESTVGTSSEAEVQMIALVGKLSQLQAKKQNIDQLIAELSATKIPEQCTSQVKSKEDKEKELEGLKSQLAHLKELMDKATNGKQQVNDDELLDEQDDEPDKPNDDDFAAKIKPKMDEIQAVTKELKEQAAMLQAARAEVAALKQAYSMRSSLNTASNSPASSTPIPAQHNDNPVDFKSDNANNDSHQPKAPSRKDQCANETTNVDWYSRRESNSGHSRASGSNNFSWFPPGPNGLQERSTDDNSLPEHLDLGLQVPIEDNYPRNWIGVPYPPVVPATNGAVNTAEFYRQLFLGSQAHQIQMMNGTIQNCCEMLHSQQKEMLLMRKAIVDLQNQVRHFQAHDCKRNKNEENAGVNSEHLYSLTNLSSIIDTSSGIHQSNKLPFLSRNNYQDNLRSSIKPDDSTLDLTGIGTFSTNSITIGLNNSSLKEKQNQSSDTLDQVLESNALDSVSFKKLQDDDDEDEDESLRTDTNVQIKEENILEEENSFYRLLYTNDTDLSIKKEAPYQFEKLSDELKETLYSFVMANINRSDYLMFVFRKLKIISEDEYLRLSLLKALCKLGTLQTQQNTLADATDQTMSESVTSGSTDGEYELDAQVSAIIINTNEKQPIQFKPISNHGPINTDTISCSTISPLASGYRDQDLADLNTMNQ